MYRSIMSCLDQPAIAISPPLGTPGGKPPTGRCVPQNVRGEPLDLSSLGASLQGGVQGLVADPLLPVPEPQSVQGGHAVSPPGP